MSKHMDLSKNTSTSTEPVWGATAVAAGVSAIISLLVAFGIDVTEMQAIAILGVVNLVIFPIVAFFLRPKVTPNAKVIAYTKEIDSQPVAGQASVIPTDTPVDVQEALPLP